MECIVHYDCNDGKYSELKSLSENQYERIKEAKKHKNSVYRSKSASIVLHICYCFVLFVKSTCCSCLVCFCHVCLVSLPYMPRCLASF